MESLVITVFGAALPACSALLAVLITGRMNLKSGRQQSELQLHSDSLRLEYEADRQCQQTRQQQLLNLHKAISKAERAFSITSQSILHEARMPVGDFNELYLDCCSELDEARAIADLFFPEVAEPLQKMYAEMNMYWGNMTEMLRRLHSQEPFSSQQPFREKTVHASIKIQEYANLAKGKMSRIIGE
ncbi:hypothetical protein ACXUPC_10540 [Pseudomonas marginalis]|jgi:hypothetical protein|uniref:hypothetical protein n=1 Tax=Pseudomonas marginalis TaxID=298 RepID=UPI0038B50CFA